ncbi:acetyltransferase (GNAT) family protein [Streptomyces sp. 3211.6]|uniref:GNAT family N-acetyltransferase n=1 Tax=Streptomyces sp. 3211.6 TaxID=1938845 RepID=UPI000EB41AC0|nr:GNAT family N-acetyltransferase [Streptomyces sp. 3211.6]RKT08579.1 acetyltransferase (GNAT) family protein [Streptomyces sp. 3211.6]
MTAGTDTGTGSATRIRGISPADWDAVAALEAAVYGPRGLSEGRTALEARGEASPSTCFALHHELRLAGYLLAFPYPPGRCPDLLRPERTAHRSDNLHLHDIAVAEDLRGKGYGRTLLHHLSDAARAAGYRRISLVAVSGMDTFWAALGYRPQPGVTPPPHYGGDAVYMSKTIREGRPHGAQNPRAPHDTHH